MEEELNTLTTLAYSAALDDAKWAEFLMASSTLAGGGIRTCLFGYDARAGIDLGAHQFGYDPGFEQSYGEYYAEKDFIAAKLLNQQASRVVPYKELWDEERWQRTEFYNEWVRPQEDITAGCSVLLFNQEQRLFAFSGSIREKDANHLEEPWQYLVNRLTPHLQQAFEIARTLAGAEIEKQALVNVEDPSTAGCLLVSGNRTILYANTCAGSMLEDGSVIQQNLLGRLTFSNSTWEQRFGEAMAKIRSSRMYPPQTLQFVDHHHQQILACRIAPLQPDKLGYQPTGILFDQEEPCFLLTLSRQSRTSDLFSRLRKEFRLTPSETQVLLHLSSGASTRETAEMRDTSVNTVRNQTQSILGKMGLRRQTDMVRVVESLRQNSGN